MDEAMRFLAAIEAYYGKEYTPAQKMAIASGLSKKTKPFLLELYKATIEEVSGQYGRLPDLAQFRGVMTNMPPLETVVDRTALPAPEDRSEEVFDKVQELLNKGPDEFNHAERERVRNRVRRGEASEYERRWIHVIDDLDGNWRGK